METEIKEVTKDNKKDIYGKPIKSYKTYSSSVFSTNFAGQAQDTILDKEQVKLYNYEKTKDYTKNVWEKEHLNDLNAGTKKQQDSLDKAGIKGQNYDYDKAVTHLKKEGIYEDNGYKYGNGWLVKPLDKDTEKKTREFYEDKSTGELK